MSRLGWLRPLAGGLDSKYQPRGALYFFFKLTYSILTPFKIQLKTGALSRNHPNAGNSQAMDKLKPGVWNFHQGSQDFSHDPLPRVHINRNAGSEGKLGLHYRYSQTGYRYPKQWHSLLCHHVRPWNGRFCCCSLDSSSQTPTLKRHICSGGSMHRAVDLTKFDHGVSTKNDASLEGQNESWYVEYSFKIFLSFPIFNFYFSVFQERGKC